MNFLIHSKMLNYYLWFTLTILTYRNEEERRRHRGQTLDTAGEEDSDWNERAALTYIHRRVWDREPGGSCSMGAGSWARCSDNQGGGMGCGIGGRLRTEETYVYLRLIHNVLWQKPTQYCQATILQSKTNFKIRKNEAFLWKQNSYRFSLGPGM